MTALFILSGCKIAGERAVKPTEEQQLAVFNIIEVEQWALSSFDFADMISLISGYAFVGTKASTYENRINPAYGCMYASDDLESVEKKYTLDIGELRITGDSFDNEVLPKMKDSHIFGKIGRFPNGIYNLTNGGNSQGSFKFEQDFKILEQGSKIKVTSGTVNSAQELPSPDFVDFADPRYVAVLEKGQDVKVEFSAPADVSYVKVTLSDNSKSGTDIVCYGNNTDPIIIPAVGLSYFRTTNDAVLYVDFVHANRKTDAQGLKESIVLSFVRHVHGLKDFDLADRRETVRFGELRIQ